MSHDEGTSMSSRKIGTHKRSSHIVVVSMLLTAIIVGCGSGPVTLATGGAHLMLAVRHPPRAGPRAPTHAPRHQMIVLPALFRIPSRVSPMSHDEGTSMSSRKNGTHKRSGHIVVVSMLLTVIIASCVSEVIEPTLPPPPTPTNQAPVAAGSGRVTNGKH